MQRHHEHPHQDRDVSDPLSHPNPMPRLKPAIVNMTLSTTTIDNASAGRRKGRHRSSLPMRKDNRIAAIGKQKNDMLPTMLWILPTVVASSPTSIGKIPASSPTRYRGQGEKAPRKTYQVARCLNRAQLPERA